MKQLHSLWDIAAALLVCAGFAACSQDALDDGQGNSLPEGMYPLELTAGGLQAVAAPETRSTIDGTWDGDESVAVRVNGNIKKYTATPSASGSSTATLTGIDITEADTDFWWTASGESKTVDAWYPYSAEQPKDWPVSLKQDETTIAAEDLMYASSTSVTQASSRIVFEHMLAKVIINLNSSDYLSEASEVSVSLTGQYQTGMFQLYGEYPYFSAKARDSPDCTITTYRLPTPNDGYFATYQALVIPLSQSDNPCIRINVDGTEYSYTIVKDVGSIFIGGNQYTFNITVRAQGLEVNSYNYPTWEEGGSASGSITITN